MIRVESLVGPERSQALPALAELRIRVFREWPYLYEGSLEYEQRYLEKFSAAEDSLIVVARDGAVIVGASTASPLVGHADAFAAPFEQRGMDRDRIFYFGESVLLPAYRGSGIGHAFFDHREQHARSLGTFDWLTFCAVVRPEEDERMPDDYRTLDGFWRKRGFEKMEGLTTDFSWKEPGSSHEVSHVMQFWGKRL
ncbi:MAG: GNAT family N-acetyltransferase [Puniceicoccaceae bacterium]